MQRDFLRILCAYERNLNPVREDQTLPNNHGDDFNFIKIILIITFRKTERGVCTTETKTCLFKTLLKHLQTLIYTNIQIKMR